MFKKYWTQSKKVWEWSKYFWTSRWNRHLKRIWLIFATKIEPYESICIQSSQFQIELNSSLWQIIVTIHIFFFILINFCQNRFENIIRAQFFGHTHNDQFLVFYDAATQSRPVNLGFITPSVTTYTGLNPSYTIYTVDGPGESASYVRLIGQTSGHYCNQNRSCLRLIICFGGTRKWFLEVYNHFLVPKKQIIRPKQDLPYSREQKHVLLFQKSNI